MTPVIAMSLTCLMTLIALAVAYVVFSSSKAHLLESAKLKLAEEERLLHARDDALTNEFVAQVESGKTLEQALPQYQGRRRDINPAGTRGAEAYDWDVDDVNRWADEEWARRSAEVSRSVLVPGSITSLGVLVVGAVILGVLYHFEGARKVDPTGVPTQAVATTNDADADDLPDPPAAPAVPPANPAAPAKPAGQPDEIDA